MEKTLGDQKFQHFLKVYLDQFMMASVTSDDFIQASKKFIGNNYGKAEADTILTKIDFQQWIYKSELPPN